MIRLALAQRLHAQGVPWSPSAGDRFVVPGRGMDGEVFVVSDMTIQVHELPCGPVVRFNGTTEWALDSLEQDEVLWLPREDQLRDLLGGRFVRLEVEGDGYAVVVRENGREQRHEDPDVESAYACGLLALLETDDDADDEPADVAQGT